MDEAAEATAVLEGVKEEGLLLKAVEKNCLVALLKGDDEVGYYVSFVTWHQQVRCTMS